MQCMRMSSYESTRLTCSNDSREPECIVWYLFSMLETLEWLMNLQFAIEGNKSKYIHIHTQRTSCVLYTLYGSGWTLFAAYKYTYCAFHAWIMKRSSGSRRRALEAVSTKSMHRIFRLVDPYCSPVQCTQWSSVELAKSIHRIAMNACNWINRMCLFCLRSNCRTNYQNYRLLCLRTWGLRARTRKIGMGRLCECNFILCVYLVLMAHVPCEFFLVHLIDSIIFGATTFNQKETAFARKRGILKWANFPGFGVGFGLTATERFPNASTFGKVVPFKGLRSCVAHMFS